MRTINQIFGKNILLSAAMASIFALFGMQNAFAHAHIKSTTPEANSTTTSVDQVCAEFGSALEPAFSKIDVFNNDNNQVNKEKSSVSNENKTICVATPELSAGDYQAKWVAVAADGHRINGDFKFTVQ